MVRERLCGIEGRKTIWGDQRNVSEEKKGMG